MYRRTHSRIKDITAVAVNVAIIVVSSWISIPWAVNFSLQTLAIFTVCSVFDFRRSILSVSIYIMLGVCGLPVFSGFSAGPAALLGPTGGYIFGFLFVPVIMQLLRTKNKKSIFLRISVMLMALCVIYAFGTLWYYFGYSSGDGGILQILTICVIPFIVPDILKIILAAVISSRLSALNI